MQDNDHYKPSDDTFLLAGCLHDASGDAALEIGTGSGYIAALLKERFNKVVATDLNFDVFREARTCAKNVSFVCCDGSSAVSGIKFDLIVINPPYLPSETIDDITVDGGAGGIEVTLRMVKDTLRLLKPGGSMLVVSSSVADYHALMGELEKIGLKTGVVAEKSFDFEKIIVLKASSVYRV